ncbi:hypothetical protein BC832DRAFT_558265 [Gaertneriomyces semiglobifer]|nr:hypothetical protein BC832DRAFT_558265 [Gaertneriomyces semiglobifer]
MSWFDTQKLAALASKVQHIAENALNEDGAEPAKQARQTSTITTDDAEASLRDQSELSLQLAERDQRINELELQLRRSQASSPLSTSSASASNNDEQVLLLKQKLGKAIGHLKNLNEERGSLVARIANLEQELSSLRAQSNTDDTDRLRAALEEEADRCRALELQAQALKNETDARVAQHDAQVLEKEQLRARVTELEEIVHTFQSAPTERSMSENVDGVSAALEERYTAIISSKDEEILQLRERCASVPQLEQRLHELNNLNAEMRRALDDMTKADAESSRVRDVQDGKIHSLQVEHANLEKELQDARSNEAHVRKALLEKEQALKERSETVQQLEDALHSRKADDTISKLETELQTLTLELQRARPLEAENLELRRQLEALQDSRSQSENTRIHELEAEVRRLVDDLRSRPSVEGTENAGNSDNGDGWDDWTSDSKTMIDETQSLELQAKNADLEDRLHKKMKEVEQLEVRLEDVETQYYDVVQQLDDVSAELREVKTGNSEALFPSADSSRSAQLVESLTTERDLALEQVRDLNAQLHDVTNRADATISEWQARVDELIVKHEEERKQDANSQEQVDALTNDLDHLRLEVSSVTEKLTVAVKEKQRVEAVLKDAHTDTDEVERLRAECERYAAVVARQEIDTQTISAELDQARAAYHGCSARMEEALAELQQAQQAAETSGTIAQLEDELRMVRTENESLRLKVQELESVIQPGLRQTSPSLGHDKLFEIINQLIQGNDVGRLWDEVLNHHNEEDRDALNAVRRALEELRGVKVPSTDTSDSKSMHEEYEQRLSAMTTQHETLTRQLEELQALHTTATADVQRLSGEKALLMDKLREMKTTVATRLQGEASASQRLREDLTAVQEENATLRTQVERLKSSQTELTRVHVELESSREATARLERELERLRNHLVETEDAQVRDAMQQSEAIAQYIKQIEQLESQRDEWEDAVQQERVSTQSALDKVEELQAQIQSLHDTVSALRGEKDRQAQAAENLQRVLNEFQQGQEKEVAFATHALKAKIRELEEAVDGWKVRASELESKTALVLGSENEMETLRKDVAEKNAAIGKLRRDVIQLQSHLSEAMQRLRSSPSESVDRTLIVNLLVSFLQLQRGDPKRFQTLSVISSVLGFTDEEKVKVGLMKPAAGWRAEEVQGESFTDMWIGFLLKESARRGDPPRRPSFSPTSSQADLLRRPSHGDLKSPGGTSATGQ